MKIHIELQPKQEQLYNAIMDQRPDAPSCIGFGGARGAAKSGGVRRIALQLAISSPVVIWIIRRVCDDLQKDHIDTMWLEYPDLQQFYRAQHKELRVPCGNNRYSSIFFIHAGDPGRSKKKSRGPQAHYIFLEQAEEFSQEEMEQYKGSNRAPGVAPGVCKRVFTFNPGGIGTNYLRRIFWKREFNDNEEENDFLFIQGYGWDNYEWFRGLGTVTREEFYLSWTDARRKEIFITQTDFGRNLNTLPPAQRIGELEGSFEHFSGQYYADVWEEKSLILSQEQCSRLIKPWWVRWLATDWGFSHYAATGWFASGIVRPEEVQDIFGVASAAGVRVIVLYRELVVCDLPEPELARMICAMTPEFEKRELRFHFMGQDAWAKRGSANTVVEQMDPILAAGGHPRLDKADWDRVGGWRLIYNGFQAAKTLRRAQRFEDRPEDVPAMFISASCVETIQAFPILICDYDPIARPNGNVQDVRKLPGQVSDDVADAFRYGTKSYLNAQPGIPAQVARQEEWQKHTDPTSAMIAMRKLESDQRRGQFLRRRIRGR